MQFKLQIAGLNKIPRHALRSFEEIARDLDTVITDIAEEVQPGATVIRLEVNPVISDEPEEKRLLVHPSLRMSFSILDNADQPLPIPALKRLSLDALFFITPSRVVLIRMPVTGHSEVDDFEGHTVTDIVIDFTDAVMQLLCNIPLTTDRL